MILSLRNFSDLGPASARWAYPTALGLLIAIGALQLAGRSRQARPRRA